MGRTEFTITYLLWQYFCLCFNWTDPVMTKLQPRAERTCLAQEHWRVKETETEMWQKKSVFCFSEFPTRLRWCGDLCWRLLSLQQQLLSVSAWTVAVLCDYMILTSPPGITQLLTSGPPSPESPSATAPPLIWSPSPHIQYSRPLLLIQWQTNHPLTPH